jgi:hypothetical protein
LEQAFNSLDAQREACASFILSQKHEGWTVLPTFYDDGGFSGGTMERPGAGVGSLHLFPSPPSLAGARHHHVHHRWSAPAATHREAIDAPDASATSRLDWTAKAARLPPGLDPSVLLAV